MKFVLRILIYLVATIASFVLYVLLFMVAAGLTPQQSIEVLREKVEVAAIDSTATETGEAPMSDAMKAEVQKARGMVSDEMAELESEKNKLLSEKQELEKLRDEIARLLAKKSKAEEERMYNLAKIYDGMDQERLAEVFTRMNDTLIVNILPKMKANNASLVLEYLPPGRSAQISHMLLGGM